LDNWFSWINLFSTENSKLSLVVAAISVVIFAATGAAAGYIYNYFSENVALNVANDLRRKLYHHLHIKAGQHVGTCGPTRSGKSTLAILIPGFYDPDSGQVFIDNVDITDYKLQGLRNQLTFVMQELSFFFGSIRENIAYGTPEAREDEIIQAVRLANAEEFILKMPHGYDSHVGERDLT
jgi:ABC-type multidrug transport system fused ATPase/permease subunit